jgi:hypothetical protein
VNPHLLLTVALVCGAVVPGPCSYEPDGRWECSLGDPCPETFACAKDGYCKSADIACADDEALCAYDGLDAIGICVNEAAFQTDSAHCGGCFARCRGGVTCEAGACIDEPAAGRCVLARGNFDCQGGEGCVDDGGGAIGRCERGALGQRRVFEDCDDGSDCEGGLCDGGVCTRPCDFGCPADTVCDADAIPGGLCTPLPPDERCEAP